MRYSNWSNFLYLLVPVAAYVSGLGPVSVAGIAVCWSMLALGSYMGHTRQTRFWWKADVLAMYAATLSLGVAALAGMFSPLAWALLPAVLGAYWWMNSNRNMEMALGVFAAFSLGSMVALQGLYGLLPLPIFGAGIVMRKALSKHEGDVYHGHWHTATTVAGIVAVCLL